MGAAKQAGNNIITLLNSKSQTFLSTLNRAKFAGSENQNNKQKEARIDGFIIAFLSLQVNHK